LEAMAAGCRIVTSNRGALPETTAGFASLVPFSLESSEFGPLYFEALAAALHPWTQDPTAVATSLIEQSNYVLANFSWEQQTDKWEEMANKLMSGKK
ncbi:MAG TPA: hypothetical protein V6D23_12685, partial [Candidatus Obscuribacterales bacterium]